MTRKVMENGFEMEEEIGVAVMTKANNTAFVVRPEKAEQFLKRSDGPTGAERAIERARKNVRGFDSIRVIRCSKHG